jgi:hypothetical protein
MGSEESIMSLLEKTLVVIVSFGVFFIWTLFHNFLGMKGVTNALAKNGRIENFKNFQLPVVATAFIALMVLIVLDVTVLRSTAGYR